MRLAEQGDIFSPTSNFLRDTLFNGNQELYDAFRNDVSAATMIANLTLISIPSVNQGSSQVQNNTALKNELANNGIRHNPNDIVFITRLPNGKIVWLENGNSAAGLQHITARHADHFAARGVTDIPGFLKQLLQTDPLRNGMSNGRPFVEFMFEGRLYRVAIGTNGFIVSFYPIN